MGKLLSYVKSNRVSSVNNTTVHENIISRGCIHLVHKDNTIVGMILDFGREDLWLWDGEFRCFIPVLNYMIQASRPVLFWALAPVFSSVGSSYTIQPDKWSTGQKWPNFGVSAAVTKSLHYSDVMIVLWMSFLHSSSISCKFLMKGN